MNIHDTQLQDAVSVVIENKKGEIICVSRKSDHTDFGLPGGKVDSNETYAQAIVRETKEETGIILDINKLKKVYEDHRYGRFQVSFVYTEQLDLPSEYTFKHSEPHLVKFGTWKDIKRGSFGEYNTNLYNILSYEK